MYKLDLDKLAKVLGMMGSDHDGEAMAAARAAVKMIKDANTTWHEVLGPKPSASPSPFDFWPQQSRQPQRPQQERPHYEGRWQPEDEDDHRTAARMLYDWWEHDGLFLYEREPDFLSTVMDWYRPLTDAQQSWFDKIVLRARRNGYPI